MECTDLVFFHSLFQMEQDEIKTRQQSRNRILVQNVQETTSCIYIFMFCILYSCLVLGQYNNTIMQGTNQISYKCFRNLLLSILCF